MTATDLGVVGPARVTYDRWDRGYAVNIVTPVHDARVIMSLKGHSVDVVIRPAGTIWVPRTSIEMRVERGPRFWVATSRGWEPVEP